MVMKEYSLKTMVITSIKTNIVVIEHYAKSHDQIQSPSQPHSIKSVSKASEIGDINVGLSENMCSYCLDPNKSIEKVTHLCDHKMCGRCIQHCYLMLKIKPK